MARFQFRLEKVLQYRESVEREAKKAFLGGRAQTLAAVRELEALQNIRQRVASKPLLDLAERMALEQYLLVARDRERDQQIVIQTLADEEEGLRQKWLEARKEAETLRKLRDSAWQEWSLDNERRSQASLDEWAVLRRPA